MTHLCYVALIALLLSLGFCGRQADNAALAERDTRIAALQSDLALCRASATAQDAALDGLRARLSAGQDNCAAALKAMRLIQDISLPPSPLNSRHAAEGGAISPAASSAVKGPEQSDAAFTDFLNTF